MRQEKRLLINLKNKDMKKILIYASALLMTFANSVHGSTTNINTEPMVELPRFTIVDEMNTLSEYSSIAVNDLNVLHLLIDLGVQHPYIVMAQMKIESGNYSSALTKSNNNYFGMRHPAQRMTVSMGSKNGYAKYHNWAYSVLDYALWQRKYAWNMTETDYLNKLGRTYAQDPSYATKVKNIAKNLENKK